MWMVVIFANVISPCMSIDSTSTEDALMRLPAYLLACYYATNVYRVATKRDTNSPFYSHLGHSLIAM